MFQNMEPRLRGLGFRFDGAWNPHIRSRIHLADRAEQVSDQRLLLKPAVDERFDPIIQMERINHILGGATPHVERNPHGSEERSQRVTYEVRYRIVGTVLGDRGCERIGSELQDLPIDAERHR